LTEELLKRNPKEVFAIEFDRDLTNHLDKFKNNYNNFNYKIADALTFDEKTIFKKNSIIFGNLPYNISLKLLIKWIYSDPWPPFYDQMILMFQKEVAERIIATPNHKKYGRISILTDARLDVKFHFNISKKEFNPEPKVDSSLLSFTPKKNTNFKLNDLKILSDLTKIIFNTKRKMISKTLKKLLNEKELKIIDFDNIKNLRPENLDFSFYYKLVDLIKGRS
jgi:16S rRNA (adenine1518-N6/adenine1519-N6)-dimethyltransferase